MKKHILFSFILFLFSLTIIAQDDTEEEVLNENGFSKSELKEEASALKFEDAFIDALQQKTIENHDRALEFLATCEQLFPNNVAMLFEIAKNHFALKQYTESLIYLDKALEFEPQNFWILELKTSVFVKQHNYPEAIILQKQLYAMKNSEAGDLLRLYYYAKKKNEAIKLIKEVDHNSTYILALDFYKKYYKLSSNQTNTDISVNQDMDAISLRKDFKKNATYTKLQLLLEKEDQLKDYQALFVDSGEGLELFPAQSLVYLYHGIALNELNKPKQAIGILEEGLEYTLDNQELNTRFYKVLKLAYTTINNLKKASYYQGLLGE